MTRRRQRAKCGAVRDRAGDTAERYHSVNMERVFSHLAIRALDLSISRPPWVGKAHRKRPPVSAHAAVLIVLVCSISAKAARVDRAAASQAAGAVTAASAANSLTFVLEELEPAPTGLRLSSGATPDTPSMDGLSGAVARLNRECEPPLSRILLQIAEPADGSQLAESADAVARLIRGAAANSPASSSASSDPLPPDRDPEFIAAVADVLAALGQAAAEPNSDEPRARLLEACPRIAPYLDDSREPAAALARLLQAACYRRAGRAERATELLGPASLLESDAACELFLGAEYCRALADRRHYVAAAAVAARLEATAATRVAVEHRTTAAHLVRSVRLAIARARAAELRAQAASDVLAEVEDHVSRLERSFGGTMPVALYRLGEIVPRSGGRR